MNHGNMIIRLKGIGISSIIVHNNETDSLIITIPNQGRFKYFLNDSTSLSDNSDIRTHPPDEILR